jgi:hypothetical protein
MQQHDCSKSKGGGKKKEKEKKSRVDTEETNGLCKNTGVQDKVY